MDERGHTPGLDVVAFGTTFLEFVFGKVPGLPGPGEEIFSDQFGISCGGGALCVASAASEVGARAGLATVLGDDVGTRVAERYCAKAGVDLSVSRRVTVPTSGVTVVLNFGGDRAFISHLPARDEHGTTWWADVVRQRRPSWAYFYASEAVLPVIHEARQLGCRVAV